MKQFRIYQLPVEHKAKFMSFEFVTKHNIMPKLEEYKMVYEGEMNNNPVSDTWGSVEWLNTIFHKFNVAHPEDFRGHSLSMSDIVEVDGKYFYCDDFGWEEVTFTSIKEEEAKRYGTTAESLEEQGFIFMEEACGDCHWFAPCAEFGGTLMSLAWYREQQKNFRNEHFKKDEEEMVKPADLHKVTLAEPHIHLTKDGNILYGTTKIGTYEKDDLWKKQGGTRDRSGNKTVPYLYYVTIDAMPTDRGKRIFFSRREIKEWLSGKQITIDFNAA